MANINEKFIPVQAIHPTELIEDELKARGMQKKELAELLGMKASNFSRFLRTKENITSSMALKLENALGIPADYWMDLQLEYEKDVESIRQRDDQNVKAIQVEKALSFTLNLNILFKRLALDGYMYLKDKLDALYKLLKVESMEELLLMSAADGCFKKSDKLESENRNISSWILLARFACSQEAAELASYEPGNEDCAAAEIAHLANMQSITESDIKSILTKNGIGYCVVEKIEKAPIDAYSAILNGHPYIVVSHRRNNMDMLVFDVLHECGHIKKHLSEGKAFVSYNQNMSEAKGVEQEANQYAMDSLIAPSIWSKIMKSKSNSIDVYTLIKTVTEEAKKNGISPSIAAWRFKYETGVYQIPGYKSSPII